MKKCIDINIFANRLSYLMEQSGETIYSLADKLSLSSATISRYTNAIMKPKVTTVVSMANIFDVNEAWLMGYDVPMERETTNKTLKIEYDSDIQEIISMYQQLDERDKGEIRGEIKHMLKAEKYKKKEKAG